MNIHRIAKRIANNSNKGYLISDDEPLGLCVGFAPTADQLNSLSADVVECSIISDDGMPNSLAYYDFNNNTGDEYNHGDVIISSASLKDTNPAFLGADENKVVIDFDLEIWRSPAELEAHIDDFLHG
jgi:hypothetical protein